MKLRVKKTLITQDEFKSEEIFFFCIVSFMQILEKKFRSWKAKKENDLKHLPSYFHDGLRGKGKF